MLDVQVSDPPAEGEEYLHVSRMLPFRDAMDAVWVVERLEHLKEAHFRCTVTGTYAHFSLTSAQNDTFIEVESGMDPTSLRWTLMRTLSGSFFKGWMLEALDALPAEVDARRGAHVEGG